MSRLRNGCCLPQFAAGTGRSTREACREHAPNVASGATEGRRTRLPPVRGLIPHPVCRSPRGLWLAWSTLHRPTPRKSPLVPVARSPRDCQYGRWRAGGFAKAPLYGVLIGLATCQVDTACPRQCGQPARRPRPGLSDRGRFVFSAGPARELRSRAFGSDLCRPDTSIRQDRAAPRKSGRPRSRFGGVVSNSDLAYPRPVDRMPEPGDLIDAFRPLPDPCFRMVQSRQLQATHCRGAPASDLRRS
jgi:hypothetical protein